MIYYQKLVSRRILESRCRAVRPFYLNLLNDRRIAQSEVGVYRVLRDEITARAELSQLTLTLPAVIIILAPTPSVLGGRPFNFILMKFLVLPSSFLKSFGGWLLLAIKISISPSLS